MNIFNNQKNKNSNVINTVTINGKTITQSINSSSNVVVGNNNIVINGNSIKFTDYTDSKNIEIIINGNCNDIQTNGNVTVQGNCNDIDTNGNVNCYGDIKGDIDTNGNVSLRRK